MQDVLGDQFLDVSVQVKNTDGTWINAEFIDGAVLVNLGEMMQTWTADKYRAAVSC